VAGALAHGWRWWPPYLLLASAVALALLLAPDSYTAFGLVFLAVGLAAIGRLVCPALFSAHRPRAATALS
jgi:hypothetical protein